MFTSLLAAAANALDLGILEQLDVRERATLVHGALVERDAALQNVRFSVEEDTTNVSLVDQSVRKMGFDIYEQRRLREKRWMHQRTSYAEEFRAPGEDASAAWDGKIGRTVGKPDKYPNPLGSVSDHPSSIFDHKSYNRILGLAEIGGEESAAKWIEAASGREGGVEASLVIESGRKLVRVNVPDGPYRRRTMFLDPARGNMPIRYEYRYDDGRGAINYESTEVDEAKQIDGVWVPMKTTRRSGTSASPNIESHYVCKVTDFKIGDVTDEEFKIEFPPGTEVVDRIAKTAYRVLGGGNVEMLPLLDSDTGRVITPGNPRSVNEALQTVPASASSPAPPQTRVAAAAGALPRTPPAGNLAPRRWSLATWFTGVLGVCILLTGVVMLIQRRRQNS